MVLLKVNHYVKETGHEVKTDIGRGCQRVCIHHEAEVSDESVLVVHFHSPQTLVLVVRLYESLGLQKSLPQHLSSFFKHLHALVLGRISSLQLIISKCPELAGVFLLQFKAQ